MNKEYLVELLKAIAEFSYGFRVNDGMFITDAIDRQNEERQNTFCIEDYVNIFYDDIIDRLNNKQVGKCFDCANYGYYRNGYVTALDELKEKIAALYAEYGKNPANTPKPDVTSVLALIEVMRA